ncbi:hypothetical protein KJZ71_04955 [Patescibacteria group bacterium]|nr:hypothetical protein [Patescibacteria group bacterium]
MTIQQHELPIAQITQTIGMEDDFLVSRLTGKNFAAKLQEILQNFPEEVVALLDFSAVDLMDGSFADEVFGTIAAARGRRQLFIAPFILVSLNAMSLDNLEQALLSRPVREESLRNCVVPVKSEDGEISLVGKFEEHVQQTFTLLNSSGELTTREVAKELDLGTAAASTRLKALYDLGLALRLEVRDDQGKSFVYRSIS